MISTTIHMGLPKTGSSSIQEFFKQNRELLGKTGIIYPKSLGLIAHRKLLALAGREEYQKFDPDYISKNQNLINEEIMQKLRAELASIRANRVIISCEDMAYAPHADYQRLLSCLNSCGLRVDIVVLYLRPQAEWRKSLIQQRIKMGTWSNERLYPLDDPKCCGKNGCYRDHVERRAAAFGMDKIKLRLFGREYFEGGDLYSEIKDAFTLPDMDYKAPLPMNVSLSDFACQMLIHINKFLPRYDSSGRVCLRRLHIGQMTERYLTATAEGWLVKASLPEGVGEKYERFYKESNDWIRKNFFPSRKNLFNIKTHEPIGIVGATDLALKAKLASERILSLREKVDIENFLKDLREELNKLPTLP